MAEKKLTNMTDEELDKHIEGLAEKRTDLRLLQVDAAREKEVRTALAGMSEETRRIVQLGLEGGIKVDSSHEQEAQA